jgi:hypothetical protein
MSVEIPGAVEIRSTREEPGEGKNILIEDR